MKIRLWLWVGMCAAFVSPVLAKESAKEYIDGQEVKNTVTNPVKLKIDMEGVVIPEGNPSGSMVDSLQGYSCAELSFNTRDESTPEKKAPLDLSKYLKKKVTIQLERAQLPSVILTRYIRSIKVSNDPRYYTMTACDSIGILKDRALSRLFTNMSEVEAVQATLKEHNLSTRFELTHTYPKREAITRFNETDQNFIMRLLEQNGIYYKIEHKAKGDTYVFFDDLKTMLAQGKTYTEDQLILDKRNRPLQSDARLSSEISVGTTNYRLEDYNETNGQLIGASAASIKTNEPIYTEYGITDYSPEFLERAAQIKRNALNSNTNKITVESDNPAISLGDKVQIAGKEYYVSGRALSYSEILSSTLSLLPINLDYANPIATPMPIMSASMIATVADATPDKKDRIGIRFPWMQEQPASDMYRAQRLPSPGMAEMANGDRVLVTFINGFPDRPVLIGKY